MEKLTLMKFNKYFFCTFLISISLLSYGQIVTRWHQEPPWNNGSPECNENKMLAGCGAIAVSQLLYYYQYPNFEVSLEGSYRYYCDNSGLFNLYKNFDITTYLDYGNYSELIGIIGKTIKTDYIKYFEKYEFSTSGKEDIYNTLIQDLGYQKINGIQG